MDSALFQHNLADELETKRLEQICDLVWDRFRAFSTANLQYYIDDTDNSSTYHAQRQAEMTSNAANNNLSSKATDGKFKVPIASEKQKLWPICPTLSTHENGSTSTARVECRLGLDRVSPLLALGRLTAATRQMAEMVEFACFHAARRRYCYGE